MPDTELGVPSITIYTQVPELETCDTMFAVCESRADCLVVEDFGDHLIRAARCRKHLLQEWPLVSSI